MRFIIMDTNMLNMNNLRIYQMEFLKEQSFKKGDLITIYLNGTLDGIKDVFIRNFLCEYLDRIDCQNILDKVQNWHNNGVDQSYHLADRTPKHQDLKDG